MKPPKHLLVKEAIEFATKAHGDQMRKGTDIPYITHPMGVAVLLARHGASLEMIAAGLMHDCIEDTDATYGDIKKKFGKKVADLVNGCTEKDQAGKKYADEGKKKTWRERKAHTIEELKHMSHEVAMVACADKLDNAVSIIRDYRELGEKFWERFNNASKDDQRWYYTSLKDVFLKRSKQSTLFKEYAQAVDQLSAMIGRSK